MNDSKIYSKIADNGTIPLEEMTGIWPLVMLLLAESVAFGGVCYFWQVSLALSHLSTNIPHN